MENVLNDLDYKEWMISTKSIWLGPEPVHRKLQQLTLEFSTWLREQGLDDAGDIPEQPIPSLLISESPTRDKLKVLHPATFPEPDIEKLIRFFTKKGELVVDPFLGSGSTCVAALHAGRRVIGIELYDRWAEIARQRIKESSSPQLDLFGSVESPDVRALPEVWTGDASELAASLEDGSVGFVVTSPPYWGILAKNTDHKVKAERLAHDRPTDYGHDSRDLSSIVDYQQFVGKIAGVLGAYVPKLQPGRYMGVIVSDFRHKSEFHSYHSDLAESLIRQGLTLEGITILAQTSKNLYPYGIPYAFVSNIHHQYVLIMRRRQAV